MVEKTQAAIHQSRHIIVNNQLINKELRQVKGTESLQADIIQLSSSQPLHRAFIPLNNRTIDTIVLKNVEDVR